MGDMAAIVSREIYQGETFFAEVHIRDSNGASENLAAVGMSVQCATGLDENDFTLSTTTEAGHLIIRADGTDTATWPVGTHKIQLWFDYGAAANVEDEIQLEILLTVKEAI